MRRSIAILLSVAMLLLTACAPKSAAQTDAETDLIVVGISQVGAESDWRVANTESMRAVFTEENGYRLLFDDARQKQENQITAIRKFIQQRVDYIILMPICESGWDSVLEEAKDADIPVILIDRMADVADSSLYAVHIGSDFRAEGDSAVRWLERYALSTSKGALNIIHVQGTQGSTAQLGRTAALDAAMEKHENWQRLVQLDGDFTQAKTYEVMTQYLNGSDAPQQLDAVYCENDNEAFGAMQALEEAGYKCGKNGVAIISFDATRRALECCLDGTINFVAECNPLLATLAEKAIQTLEKKETPIKQQYIDEKCFEQDDLTREIIEARAY